MIFVSCHEQVAFLIPVLTGMLQHGLVSRSSLSGEVQEPMALCIAPTRELARQIHKESCKFSLGTVMRAVVCYGGVSVSHQLQDIERGCHFLIATPGRLEDFINRGKVQFIHLHSKLADSESGLTCHDCLYFATKVIDTIFGFVTQQQQLISIPYIYMVLLKRKYKIVKLYIYIYI